MVSRNQSFKKPACQFRCLTVQYPNEEDNPRPAEDEGSAIDERLRKLWSSGCLFEPIAASDNAGQMIAQYRIRARLGAGAFGVVYLADDTAHNRPVAIKLPRPEVLLDESKRERFLTESNLISQLSHPGITEVFEAGFDGPTPFIATEWCNGPDLSVWLADRQSEGLPLPTWQEAVEFVAAVADAVDHAHQRGIAHRDLKPANILLSYSAAQDPVVANLSHYSPKVVDFGLAKLTDPMLSTTASSLLVGTPIYMAPELIADSVTVQKNSDIAADIYSLGVILFELLTGRPPVAGDTYFEILKNIRTAPRLRLSVFRKGVPRQLEKICATCLSRNPAARYASSESLALDLRRIVAGQPMQVRPISLFKRYQFWHANQDWLQTSGRFSLSYCVLPMAWFVPTAISFAFFAVVSSKSYSQMLPMAIGIFVFSLLIPAIFAAFCLKGERWAAWAGALINLPKVVSAIPGMFGAPLPFRAYYENYSPYLCFTVHLFIFVCAASKLLLYLFAIQSFWIRGRSRA